MFYYKEYLNGKISNFSKYFKFYFKGMQNDNQHVSSNNLKVNFTKKLTIGPNYKSQIIKRKPCILQEAYQRCQREEFRSDYLKKLGKSMQ